MLRTPLVALFTAAALVTAGAQGTRPDDRAAAIALAHARALPGFSESDLADLAVSYDYTDQRLGVTYVYLEQRVGALAIDRVGASVAIRGGRVYSFRENFQHDVRARLQTVVPALDDRRAIRVAAAASGIASLTKSTARPLGPTADGHRRYAGPAAVLASAIEVEGVITVDPETGGLRRALVVELDLRGGDLRRISVDAVTGEVLAAENLTHHCSFEQGFGGRAAGHACAKTEGPAPVVRPAGAARPARRAVDGSRYRVYAWPHESPNHGPQTFVTDPADPEASPFGWHDTDGAPGPEATTTRGNNADAYVDAIDNDSAYFAPPDGGVDLDFDYAYDEDAEPLSQTDATTVQLFYAVNRFHDFAWHYGFDEAAGNFQVNNYGRGGAGGDAVVAQSQDGSLSNAGRTGPTGDNLDNANFSTPRDGRRGRMQMYLWRRDNGRSPLRVAAPDALAGRSYGALGTPNAGWGQGASVDADTDIEAGVVFVVDEVADASLTDGCEPYAEGVDVRGKIAVIDRGSCEFGAKALIAQEAGAVAVLICNFEEGVGGLGAGSDGAAVTIPTFMIDFPNCARLRSDAEAAPGLTLSIRERAGRRTRYVAGSLDNGIVAHEYGHGVSTRLTGGPGTGCLVQYDRRGDPVPTEQMGEGWSDFYALVTTMRPGDGPDLPRGIGTYAVREATDGPGIRPFPYTRDMSLNPVTYGDVADATTFSAPHGVGSIWASMLWDLYWDLEEAGAATSVDGGEADPCDGRPGERVGIRLVTTALKLQPCYPGFVDGRDAILAADELLYDGRHRALIWRAFARRGLGANADQGSPDSRADQTEDFTLPLDIADRAFFTKAVTEDIDPGGEVTVALRLANWIDSVKTLPTVRIADVLPKGATLVSGSATGGELVRSGDLLAFEFTDVRKGDTVDVTYRYVAPEASSALYWYEPIADASAVVDFEISNARPGASTDWDFVDDGLGDGGALAFAGVNEESQPTLALHGERPVTVTGDRPAFSFYHRYGIDADHEGAFVQVRRLGEAQWQTLPREAFLRNGYSAQVPYRVFSIPFLEGFGPAHETYTQSLIDLSAYAGETILLRWRHGRGGRLTEDSAVGAGWTIDELAQVDVVAYNTTATLTIGESETEAKAPGVGTLVRYGRTAVEAEDFRETVARFEAYPNPSSGGLALRFGEASAAGSVEVVSVTGQRVLRQALTAGQSRVELDLGGVAAGVYAVRVSRGGETSVVRVVRR